MEFEMGKCFIKYCNCYVKVLGNGHITLPHLLLHILAEWMNCLCPV